MVSEQLIERVDCLVVGGGPAGLTAAIYLARFHLTVLVIDAQEGRMATIPATHNHAGFPQGIAGRDLLARMSEQARRYGARIERDTVQSLTAGLAHKFTARTTTRHIEARSVLLATGVVNRRPDMPRQVHDDGLARGLIRYCPICDGFEVTDKPVAVLGTGQHGANEAEFLRSFTADVTLIAPGSRHDLDQTQQARLAAAGIALLDGPCSDITPGTGEISIVLPSGTRVFASLYPAIGSDVRSALATGIGCLVTDEGCLKVDRHQRTNIDGVYAAGDVVLGLDQISNAMGQAGVAATAIRNDLAKASPLRR